MYGIAEKIQKGALAGGKRPAAPVASLARRRRVR
jgi:hypothetical protein